MRGAENGKIIRLRAAGCKNDLSRIAMDELRKRITSLIHKSARVPALLVDAGRISKDSPGTLHLLRNPWIERSRGVVIKIDSGHKIPKCLGLCYHIAPSNDCRFQSQKYINRARAISGKAAS